VLSPTIVAGHETVLKQVHVKDFLGRVILLILTHTTWTDSKTIPLVRISYTEETLQARNEIV
jgi:hypothetical protein